MKQIDITEVQRGDVVQFKSYALRVESEPVLKPGSITLQGRINADGCPLVTKRFMAGRTVQVNRD